MSSGDLSVDLPPLPLDVIIQILARLPIKPLFRFRSVSKSLHRLPLTPHFIRLHFLSSPHTPTLLIDILSPSPPLSSLLSITFPDPPFPLPLSFLPDRVKLRASCNGLLCCASLSDRGIYYVCNPLTRQYRPLPRFRQQPFTRCSPDYESTLAGIAVDPSKPGFKLLLAGFYRPFGRLPQNQLVCQVFDSMSNAWTRLVFSHYDEFTHMNRNQVVYADGALHWLTQSCLYVFAFDVSDCVWKKIQLPDEVVAAREGARAYLLEMEGAVSVIRITGVWMCIWVLIDPAGERWSLADRVHLRCIGAYAANVFPVSQTREVVFLASQKKVFTYGRREKVWREIYAMEGSAYPLWFSAHSFRGTLFSCH